MATDSSDVSGFPVAVCLIDEPNPLSGFSLVGCPGTPILESYLRGELADSDCLEIEQHLDRCDRCEAFVADQERWQRCPTDVRQACPRPDQRPPDGVSSALEQPPLRTVIDHGLDVERREIDDFILIAPLGRGGFATVYLAQQKSLQRRVALKLSRLGSHEAPVLSKLDHPHIVRVFDERYLADEGLHLLYMQYAPGGSLKDVLDQLQATPVDRRTTRTISELIARRLGEQGEIVPRTDFIAADMDGDWATAVCRLGARLADALDYSHRAGVVHRDLKPGNVLLSVHGQPLLADFNRSFGAQVNGSHPEIDFGGSRPYMSPEQLEVFLHRRPAEEVGPASDLYSLGILLWECLLGSRPFTAASERDSLLALEQRRLGLNLDSLPTSIPAGLRRVLRDCLVFDQTQRWQDAGVVARRLELAAHRDVDRLLSPWLGTVQKLAAAHPVWTLLLCGLGPNLTIAALNILYQQFYSGLDQTIHNRAEVIVNLVVFTAAIVVLLRYAQPLITVVLRDPFPRPIDDAFLQVAAQRFRKLATVAWAWILFLWFCTGVIFPAINWFYSQVVTISLSQCLQFLVAQLLHGIIAASVTFLLATFVMMQAFWPRLMEWHPQLDDREWLTRHLRLVDWHAAILGLTPSLALMALAVVGHQHRALLSILGLFGLLSFGVALVVVPRIRANADLLTLLMTPTRQLIHGKAVVSSGGATRELPNKNPAANSIEFAAGFRD